MTQRSHDVKMSKLFHFFKIHCIYVLLINYVLFNNSTQKTGFKALWPLAKFVTIQYIYFIVAKKYKYKGGIKDFKHKNILECNYVEEVA